MTIPDIASASGIGHALASWQPMEGVMKITDAQRFIRAYEALTPARKRLAVKVIEALEAGLDPTPIIMDAKWLPKRMREKMASAFARLEGLRP